MKTALYEQYFIHGDPQIIILKMLIQFLKSLFLLLHFVEKQYIFVIYFY